MEIQYTDDVTMDGFKVLCYGESGAGKTRLIGTLPNPFIFSVEKGLLSLKDVEDKSGKKLNLPYFAISNMQELGEAYEWALGSKEAQKYDSIALDSITDIAEICLSAEKVSSKDGRAAYGAANEAIAGLIRGFRDLPNKHIYMSAHLDKSTDEQGRVFYGPAMPGKTLSQQIPYFFDFVFALRVEKDGEGKDVRALQCEKDGLWLAKHRTITLGKWEEPDLGDIIERVSG